MFRSFNTVNMGSVGQRASKLLAVKVGGLKKKSAIWPWPLSNQSARVRLRLGSNLSQSLTDSNFAAQTTLNSDGLSVSCHNVEPSYVQAIHGSGTYLQSSLLTSLIPNMFWSKY